MRWLLFAIAILFHSSSFARSYDDVMQSGFISIAVYRDFPPYSFLEDEIPRGIDIEIGRQIAAEMGLEPRWFWLTADENLEDDLRNGIWKGAILDSDKQVADIMLRVPYDREFAYAIDGYGQAKNERVVMFAPYHRESWRIVRDTAKTGTVRNLAIFRYEKIGVEIDSLPDFFLSGTLGGQLRENVVHFPTVFEALEAMSAGELGAVAGMKSQLEWGLSQQKAQFDISADGFEQLLRKEWDIGVAADSSYRQLSYAIEEILETMVRDGAIKKIFSAYQVNFQTPEFYSNN